MKAKKTLTIITVALLIAIISIASFLGIYKLKDFKVRNVVPNYLLGMEFEDSNIIELQVNEDSNSVIYDKDGNEVVEQEEGVEYTEENGYTTVETKINSDDVLTKNNFTKSKKIILNRLKALGVEQYLIKQDENTGNIKIQIPDNEDASEIISNINKNGTFTLTDKDTGEILLDNNYIENVKIVYGQAEKNTAVYLQIKFNKEGRTKLEEISKTYVEQESSTEENSDSEEAEKNIKYVAVNFNGENFRTTYFGEPILDGTLNINIGSGSTNGEVQNQMKTASKMVIILKSGVLPIQYNISDYKVNSTINNEQIKVAKYIGLAIASIMIIYLVVKLRMKGILVSVLNLGYIAILLLALRYTNIRITIDGIVGIIISILINYIYLYKAFKDIKLNYIKDITKKFTLNIIPIIIISIVFTFNNILNIASLGMTLVWGIITMYLYNLTIVQILRKVVYDGQEDVKNAKK